MVDNVKVPVNFRAKTAAGIRSARLAVAAHARADDNNLPLLLKLVFVVFVIVILALAFGIVDISDITDMLQTPTATPTPTPTPTATPPATPPPPATPTATPPATPTPTPPPPATLTATPPPPATPIRVEVSYGPNMDFLFVLTMSPGYNEARLREQLLSYLNDYAHRDEHPSIVCGPCVSEQIHVTIVGN
jgi:hypothetical protein